MASNTKDLTYIPSLWQSLDTSLAVAFFAMVIVSFFLRLQGNQQIDL